MRNYFISCVKFAVISFIAIVMGLVSYRILEMKIVNETRATIMLEVTPTIEEQAARIAALERQVAATRQAAMKQQQPQQQAEEPTILGFLADSARRLWE